MSVLIEFALIKRSAANKHYGKRRDPGIREFHGIIGVPALFNLLEPFSPGSTVTMDVYREIPTCLRETLEKIRSAFSFSSLSLTFFLLLSDQQTIPSVSNVNNFRFLETFPRSSYDTIVKVILGLSIEKQGEKLSAPLETVNLLPLSLFPFIFLSRRVQPQLRLFIFL